MPPDLETAAAETAFRDGLFSGAVPTDVTAADPAEVERRYAVYRNNVVVSLIEALRQRFPVVERLVGEEFAKAMLGAFVRAHPPRSPLMMSYGEELPTFLEGFPPVATLPYLADVARLEIARGVAYHSADAQPIDPQRLSSLAEADPKDLVLRLHPGTAVLRSRFPIFTIWAANQPGAMGREIRMAAGEAVLVARRDLTVVTRPLEPGVAAFVGALLQGTSFARAATTAIAADPQFDASRALAGLLSDRLIVEADLARPRRHERRIPNAANR